MSVMHHDVVVIGGGPAGCSAAIHLAGQGARVLLCEAGAYPHDKLCGEFLSPECAVLLARLGMAPPGELRARQLDVARITAPDGTSWEAPFPAPAWGLSRRTLDARLAERACAAGVELREGTAVAGISGDLEHGFTLETRRAGWASSGGPAPGDAVGARLVVGAYGKRATLDRLLGRRFLAHRQPYVAFKAHHAGPPLPGRIELHAFGGGYCGLSETEDGAANVCFLAHTPVFAAAGDPEAFVRWMGAQNPRLGDWLGRAERLDGRWLSIAQVPFVQKEALAGDVLMAGDAAGLVVPLAGDGISMALRGGELAAVHAAAFLAGSVGPRPCAAPTPPPGAVSSARAWRWGASCKP